LLFFEGDEANLETFVSREMEARNIRRPPEPLVRRLARRARQSRGAARRALRRG
jgi:hypothetical protein